MIYSMTGYGRKEAGEGDLRFTVEIRSLNNRFIDIVVKSPRTLAVLEQRVKRIVQDRFSRGRFEIFIARAGEQDRAGRVTINEKVAGQYIEVLRDLKTRFGLAGELDVSTVAGFPDVVTMTETKEDPEAIWTILSAGVTQALEELARMRKEEGAVLSADVLSRLEIIERLTSKIRIKAPGSIEVARKRMTEAVARLLNEQPDPVRIAQEIAILAERTDVTEELTRLGSHIGQFRSMMRESSREGVGRKLDFLIQEMGREANTIASKATDAEISLDVVQIKAELEKIREQVQNLE